MSRISPLYHSVADRNAPDRLQYSKGSDDWKASERIVSKTTPKYDVVLSYVSYQGKPSVRNFTTVALAEQWLKGNRVSSFRLYVAGTLVVDVPALMPCK